MVDFYPAGICHRVGNGRAHPDQRRLADALGAVRSRRIGGFHDQAVDRRGVQKGGDQVIGPDWRKTRYSIDPLPVHCGQVLPHRVTDCLGVTGQ